jgi:hypothetical protein
MTLPCLTSSLSFLDAFSSSHCKNLRNKPRNGRFCSEGIYCFCHCFALFIDFGEGIQLYFRCSFFLFAAPFGVVIRGLSTGLRSSDILQPRAKSIWTSNLNTSLFQVTSYLEIRKLLRRIFLPCACSVVLISDLPRSSIISEPGSERQ